MSIYLVSIQVGYTGYGFMWLWCDDYVSFNINYVVSNIYGIIDYNIIWEYHGDLILGLQVASFPGSPPLNA